MKKRACLTILFFMVVVCQAQDYIKPLRFDTVPCKILQEDSLWIYYQSNPRASVRRYKKSDIAFYSYFGNVVVLTSKPNPVQTLLPKIKPRNHPTGQDSILVAADKLHNQAEAMQAGAAVLGIFGYTGMSLGILSLLLEGNPATFVNSSLLVSASFILNIAANSKKHSANKLKYTWSPTQALNNPFGMTKADSTSR